MALYPIEWWLMIRALIRLARIEIGLKKLTLPDLADRLGAPLDLAEHEAPPEWSEHDLSTREWRDLVAVDRTARRWPFGDTCLRRSLAIAPCVQSRSPRLRVGVARLATDEPGAHSWLECEGFSIGSDTDIDYSPLRSPAPL